MILTRKEKEALVIKLAEEGKSNRQISQRVFISLKDIDAITPRYMTKSKRLPSIPVPDFIVKFCFIEWDYTLIGVWQYEYQQHLDTWSAYMYKSSDEWSDPDHSLNYLGYADSFPHRNEGEAILLENIPANATRILDIGSGAGRLINIIKENSHKSNIEFVALDISPTMLKSLKHNFANDASVKVMEHDLDTPLPDLGYFDAIVTSFAIHHLRHVRKHSLYEEIYGMLNPTGVFCNLEHVSSISTRQQIKFLSSTGMVPSQEDKTNRLLSVERQLQMLRDIGFIEVDCLWKWYEMALLIGFKN